MNSLWKSNADQKKKWQFTYSGTTQCRFNLKSEDDIAILWKKLNGEKLIWRHQETLVNISRTNTFFKEPYALIPFSYRVCEWNDWAEFALHRWTCVLVLHLTTIFFCYTNNLQRYYHFTTHTVQPEKIWRDLNILFGFQPSKTNNDEHYDLI